MCAPPSDAKCNTTALTQEVCAEQCWCRYGHKDNNGLVCENASMKQGCNSLDLLGLCKCRSKPGNDHCDGKSWLNIGKEGAPLDKKAPEYKCPEENTK